jgi:hypothetical protein
MSNTVTDFNMPVKVYVNGKEKWLEPTTEWKEIKGIKKNATLKVDPNFYVEASSEIAAR